MTNFFKISKSPILGPYWVFLAQIWTKMSFPGKRTLSVFQYLNYLPLCQNSEKPNEPFLRKLLDGLTKNQFAPLISLWDTANFRILWFIENCRNLVGEKNFRHIWGTKIFPNMKFVQAYKNYSNINFHYRPNLWKNKELSKKLNFLQEPWTWSIFLILGAKHDFQKTWLCHTQHRMGP